MPLPTLSLAQTRQRPASLTGPAIDAFLAVSQDFRNQNIAAGRSFYAGQELGLRREASARADDANQRAEERQDVFLEQAEYEKRVLRPLQREANQLRIEAQRFQLDHQRSQALTDKAIIDDFQRESSFLRQVSSGEIQVREPVTELTENTTYWNEVTSKPVVAVKKGDGIVLLGEDREVVETKPSNLRKIKTYDAGNPIYDMKGVLADARLFGNPQARRAQDTLSLYQDMREKAAASPRAAKLLGPNLELLAENIGRDPFVAMLARRGDTDTPIVREMKERAALESFDSKLSLLVGDAEKREIISENPQLRSSISKLPPDEQMSALKAFLDRREKLEGGTRLTPDQKAVISIQRKLRAADFNVTRLRTSLEQEIQKPDSDDKTINVLDMKEALKKAEEDRGELEAELHSYSTTTTTGPAGNQIDLPTRSVDDWITGKR